MKILVVDDSRAARMLIVNFIGNCGDHQIFEASDGREAVDQFIQHAPDFTFLDLTMPVMDGTEALKIIKESNPEALVAVLSADIQKQTVETVTGLGAMVFMKKPVSQQEIRSVLEKAQSAANGSDMEIE